MAARTKICFLLGYLKWKVEGGDGPYIRPSILPESASCVYCHYVLSLNHGNQWSTLLDSKRCTMIQRCNVPVWVQITTETVDLELHDTLLAK